MPIPKRTKNVIKLKQVRLTPGNYAWLKGVKDAMKEREVCMSLGSLANWAIQIAAPWLEERLGNGEVRKTRRNTKYAND